MDRTGGGKQLYSIQALRGLAAFLVVFAHSIEHGPGHATNAVMLTARFGVDIFFVISGLVVLLAAGPGQFAPIDFMKRRLWRVAPLYWATTLFVALTAIIVPKIFLTTTFDLRYLVNSLLFIPDARPGSLDWRPLFKLGWTLNYEMFFYGLIALTFWCRSLVLRGQILVTTLVGLMIYAAFVPARSFSAFYASYNLLPFIAGVALAMLVPQRIAKLPKSTRVVGLVIAIAATVAFYQTPFPDTKLLRGHILMGAAAFMIVAGALSLEYKIRGVAWFKWCGDVSYSLYLTHMFVIGAGWAVLKRLEIGGSSVAGYVAIACMIATALVVADLTYRFVERPLLRAIGRRQKAAALPAEAPAIST